MLSADFLAMISSFSHEAMKKDAISQEIDNMASSFLPYQRLSLIKLTYALS